MMPGIWPREQYILCYSYTKKYQELTCTHQYLYRISLITAGTIACVQYEGGNKARAGWINIQPAITQKITNTVLYSKQLSRYMRIGNFQSKYQDI